MTSPPELITRVKRRIKRVGPLQLGITLAVVYAVLGVVIAPFLILSISLAPTTNRHMSWIFGLGMGLIIVIPILYGMIGFIGGVITAAIYNLVAKMTGGIEVEVE